MSNSIKQSVIKTTAKFNPNQLVEEVSFFDSSGAPASVGPPTFSSMMIDTSTEPVSIDIVSGDPATNITANLWGETGSWLVPVTNDGVVFERVEEFIHIKSNCLVFASVQLSGPVTTPDTTVYAAFYSLEDSSAWGTSISFNQLVGAGTYLNGYDVSAPFPARADSEYALLVGCYGGDLEITQAALSLYAIPLSL